VAIAAGSVHSLGLKRLGQADIAEGDAISARYVLSRNHPNPFNPTTAIEFNLPEATRVRLVVYNVLGREAARLVDGSLPAGPYWVTFDATGLPSGRYYYRLEAGSVTEARSMTLAK